MGAVISLLGSGDRRNRGCQQPTTDGGPSGESLTSSRSPGTGLLCLDLLGHSGRNTTGAQRLAEADSTEGQPSSDWEGENRPNSPTGSGPAREAESHRDIIGEGLGQGPSHQRIWQDLKTGHDFDGGYDSVKWFARRLKWTRPLPFRRMGCDAGQEAQIDLGIGAPIRKPDGKHRRTHVFRTVLSHSCKACSEGVEGRLPDGRA